MMTSLCDILCLLILGHHHCFFYMTEQTGLNNTAACFYSRDVHFESQPEHGFVILFEDFSSFPLSLQVNLDTTSK
jgi:hypothetical protein